MAMYWYLKKKEWNSDSLPYYNLGLPSANIKATNTLKFNKPPILFPPIFLSIRYIIIITCMTAYVVYVPLCAMVYCVHDNGSPLLTPWSHYTLTRLI